MDTTSLPDWKTLLEQSPEQLQAWVARIWREDPKGSRKNYNWWLGLAYNIGVKARIDLALDDPNPPDLEWAAIAITIYEYLADESAMQKSMRRKVNMILQLGHHPGHALLDANHIVRWFYDKLEMGRNEAIAKANIGVPDLWKSYPDDLLTLRYIKLRLVVIRRLVKANIIQPDDDLQQWLDIQTLLP
jgi:hypothetical protein